MDLRTVKSLVMYILPRCERSTRGFVKGSYVTVLHCRLHSGHYVLRKRGGEGLNTGSEVKGILHWLEGSLNFLFISIFEGVVNEIGLRLVLGSARCFIDHFCFWRTGKLLKNMGSLLGSR